MIVCGDFNSHHSSFGCSHDNLEGRNLIDAIHDENLYILNDGTPTLLQRHDRRPSAVDLSICSPSLAPRIDWEVLDEPFGSDHLGILITIDKRISAHNMYQVNKKWNLKSADWENYTLSSDHLLSNLILSPDPCLNYKSVLQSINAAAESSIPEFKPYLGRKPKFPPKPWWDGECDRARRLNIQALKQYKFTPNMANFINCKRTSAVSKRMYKKKKKEKWAEFCNSFNVNTPIKEIWQGVRALTRGHVAQKSSSYDWVPEFLNSLTPEIVPEQIITPGSVSPPHEFDNPFSYDEFLLVIKTCSNTSPGMDNIHYPMLANLSEYGKRVLLNVLNDVWMQGTRVVDWSDQIVVPLLKPLKDPLLASSYRPIALSSCVGKTFERLVKNRLEWWVEAHKKIPQYQNGFRKKRCTLDAISNFVSDIHQCFSDNKYMLVSNIDLTNAYNNVNISILIDKMIQIGVPVRIITHVNHLLSSRSITVRHCGRLFGPRSTHVGLPQGAVLSPLLFNIYTSDLGAAIGSEVSVSQYADDIIIYGQGDTLEEAKNKLNNAMLLFCIWCSDHGLSVSENKSSVTIFTRHRKYSSPPTLTLGGVPFRVEPIMKTLGMIIDKKLLWRQHIAHLATRCEKVLNVLRCIGRLNFGADIRTSLMVYRQIIRSRIDYGCFIYGTASKTHLHKVDGIQYKALRSCLGALRSTPINALLAEAREYPFSIRRKYLAARFITDRLFVKNHIGISKICTLAPRVFTENYWRKKKVPILVEVFCKLSHLSSFLNPTVLLPRYHHAYPIPIINYKPFISTNFYEFKNSPSNMFNTSSFISKLEQQFPHYEQFYTDGSKNIDGVGCAFYHAQTDLCMKFKLNDNMSIFTAELIAINKCLHFIQSTQLNKALVLSDSKSVLEKLKHPDNDSFFLLLDTLSALYNLLKNGRSVHLLWVRGHSGLPGNERADAEAKMACRLPQSSALPLLSPSDIKSFYKKTCYHEWQLWYENLKGIKGKFYTSIETSIPKKPWYDSYMESRPFFTTLCRLRFNHNYSPHHLARIGVRVDAVCSCDSQSPADSNHLILACTKYTTGRDDLWKAILQSKCPLPADLHTVLTYTHTYSQLYKYITQNNIRV